MMTNSKEARTTATAPDGTSRFLILAMFATVVALAVSMISYYGGSSSARSSMIFDGETFDSVEDLSTSADAIVRGKVTGVHSRQIDYGGEAPTTDEDDRSGLPLVLYEVKVDRVFSGEAKPGSTVLVAMLDDEKVESRHVTKLGRNEKAVMFLTTMDPKSTPGVDVDERFYVPLNFNNGIMTLSNGKARGSGGWVKAATRDEAERVIAAEAEAEAEGRNIEGVGREDALTLSESDLEKTILDMARS